MLQELKEYPTVWLWLFYCLFLAGITYLAQSYLFTEDVFYASYAEQLSYERAVEILTEQKKWTWLSYALLPIVYGIKFFLVACCLLMGCIFFDVKLKFGQAFKIALLADLVFIIPLLIKVFWFVFIQKNYTLQDLQQFYPLSLANLFNTAQVGTLWLYPLQTLNVFELLYIFSLGFWLYQFGAKSLDKGLTVVFASYIPALFTWIVLIMFITVNLNPNI